MTTPREIELHVGHFGNGTGASGYVDEVVYARKFMKQIYDILQANKVPSTLYEDKVSKTKRDNINRLVKHHNADRDGLIVSGHLNASAGRVKTPIGFEVLYTTQKALAQTISNKVCAVSGLKNRGAKFRNDLGVLTQTYEPAVLIEFGFVNSSVDVSIMDKKFEEICYVIAETLASYIGHTIKDAPRPSNSTEPITPNPLDVEVEKDKSTTNKQKDKQTTVSEVVEENVKGVSVDYSKTIGYKVDDKSKVYRLHTNAYESKEEAEQAITDLVKKYLAYAEVFGNDKNGYRLQSGKYSKLEDAEKAAKKLIDDKKRNYISIIGAKA